jgi:hypothetical protein
MNRGLPPSSLMATSKETLVRVDDFSKTRASVLSLRILDTVLWVFISCPLTIRAGSAEAGISSKVNTWFGMMPSPESVPLIRIHAQDS